MYMSVVHYTGVYYVPVVWLSCACHVPVVWLSCDCHVLLSCTLLSSIALKQRFCDEEL